MTVVNKSFLTILIFFCQILFPLNASALEAPRTVKAWASVLGDNIAETWNEPQHVDLYVPAITWHARFAYDKEKTDRYNERPWGAGMGKSRWDEKGNCRSERSGTGGNLLLERTFREFTEQRAVQARFRPCETPQSGLKYCGPLRRAG